MTTASFEARQDEQGRPQRRRRHKQRRKSSISNDRLRRVLQKLRGQTARLRRAQRPPKIVQPATPVAEKHTVTINFEGVQITIVGEVTIS